MKTFVEWLSEREDLNEGWWSNLLGGGGGSQTAAPSASSRLDRTMAHAQVTGSSDRRMPPPQAQLPQTNDLKSALQYQFGRRPYMVDQHLLDAIADAKEGRGNLRQALDALSAAKGFGVRAAVQQFLDSSSQTGDYQARRNASDFAAGGGSHRGWTENVKNSKSRSKSR